MFPYMSLSPIGIYFSSFKSLYTQHKAKKPFLKMRNFITIFIYMQT